MTVATATPLPRSGRRGGLAVSAGVIGISRIWAQGMQFAAFIVAARVLGPVDFGVYALALVALTLVNIVTNAGWREAIMSFPEKRSAAVRMSQVSGAAGLLVLGASAYAGHVLGWWDRPVALLLACLAVAAAFSPMMNALEGLSVVQGRTTGLAVATIVSETLGLVATVAALSQGLGLIALGLQKIVVVVVWYAMQHMLVDPIPGQWPSRAGFVALSRFSGNILVSRFASFANENTATVLIGLFLGSAEAGFYRAATRLVGAVAEVTWEAGRVIAWQILPPAFAADGDRSGTTKGFLVGLWIFACPAMVGVALTAHDIVALLLGPEWAPVSLIAVFLAARRLMLASSVALEPVLALSGFVRKAPRYAWVSAGFAIAALLVTAPIGLVSAAFGQMIAGAGTMVVVHAGFRNHADLDARTLLRAGWPIGAAAVCMGGAIWAMSYAFDAQKAPDIEASLRLLALIAVGVVVYGALLPAFSAGVRKLVSHAWRAGIRTRSATPKRAPEMEDV